MQLEHVVERLKELCDVYGYPVLFLGVLLENMGIPVPGETAVIVAGVLASRAGDYRFHLWTVILIATIAAILGDNIGFYLGRTFLTPASMKAAEEYFAKHRSIWTKLLARFLRGLHDAIKAAEKYFAKYGVFTIFFARFVTGIRVVAGPAAGAAGMPWTHFVVANAAGAVTWATAIALLGYYFGENLEFLGKILHRTGWALLGIVVVLFIGYRFYRRWLAPQRTANPSEPGPAPPETASPPRAPDGASPC